MVEPLRGVALGNFTEGIIIGVNFEFLMVRQKTREGRTREEGDAVTAATVALLPLTGVIAKRWQLLCESGMPSGICPSFPRNSSTRHVGGLVGYAPFRRSARRRIVLEDTHSFTFRHPSIFCCALSEASRPHSGNENLRSNFRSGDGLVQHPVLCGLPHNQ